MICEKNQQVYPNKNMGKEKEETISIWRNIKNLMFPVRGN